MTQRIAYYTVMNGMAGYMPDHIYSTKFATRADLVSCVNSEIERMDFPQRARRQVNLVHVWRYIQSGGNRGHFTIKGEREQLEFVQINRAEYESANEGSV